MSHYKTDQNISWEFAKSIAYAEQDIGGTLGETATYYVSTDGNDGNSGLEWGAAFSTIQHALSALPANGGVIEVGYGKFAGFTINSGQGISIRGRGIGRDVSVTDNTVPAEVHPTMITSTVTVSGSITAGLPESAWINPFDMRDLAVVNCTGDGIVINNNFCTFNRVSSSKNTGNGINFANSGNDFFIRMNDCRFLENTLAGCYGAVQTLQCDSCYFDGNKTHGLDLHGGGTELTFINCTFQRNTNYGANLGISGNVTGTTFIGCQFEHNHTYGMYVQPGQAQITCIGCFFTGDTTETYGIYYGSILGNLTLIGNYFQGHTASALHLYGLYGVTGVFIGNQCSGEAFATGTATTIPGLAAPGVIVTGLGRSDGLNPQTLAADGAVTINAAVGNIAQITLNANASSSSITNGCTGQQMTVNWIQGAGSKTYAWPTNCLFASGTAPVAANATAGYIDSVSFVFDGTNWNETSRSTGIH